ncbi:MAG TPA: tripartite tricarboxylate transporter substrate-binding protein [Burkholderiales bacterium]|nr:tripartite tricarboxylate transporter substrate-binding protein [Burkholderiales bacterium]
MPALRLIVGFSPGSASDDIANLIAAPLGAQLGRAVTIERIAGDSGTLGAQAAALSAADGNTLFIATLGTHALAPHVRKQLPYDVLRDFTPVSLLTQSPMLLACNPALPVRDAQQFIAYARAHPEVLAYGTSAIGGAPHLACELFQSITGVQLHHSRYEETQKLYADLEAGRIALSFNNIMSMLPRCNSGKLRALGVTSFQRLQVAPHIPTLAECGVQQCEVSNWVGLVAPAGTPAAMVDNMAKAAASTMNSNTVAATLNAAGVTPCGTMPAEFARFIASELNRWKPVMARFAQA